MPKKLENDGSDGLYLLGEGDLYISQQSIEVIRELYPKGRAEVVPGANHFVQQDAPQITNRLLWDFIGAASQYKVEPFYP